MSEGLFRCAILLERRQYFGSTKLQHYQNKIIYVAITEKKKEKNHSAPKADPPVATNSSEKGSWIILSSEVINRIKLVQVSDEDV